MRNKFKWSRYFVYLLISLALIGCNRTKNRTEERAKERVTQFIRYMSEDRIEEAEKLLSKQLTESETRELFLDAYDNQEIKDTSIVISVYDITFNIKGDKNRAVVSLSVRNEKLEFTKIATLPIKFEKGDWYIGG
jgi:hypothetical protein